MVAQRVERLFETQEVAGSTPAYPIYLPLDRIPKICVPWVRRLGVVGLNHQTD